MLNCSIWPIDRTLSSATTPGQRADGSDANEEVLCISQSSCITGELHHKIGLIWCLVHLLQESYPSAEMQSMYTSVPVDWAI